MLNITKSEVLKYHDRIVNRAKLAIKQNQVNKACKELLNASVWAYKFNAFYSHKESEEIIHQISEKALLGKDPKFIPRENTVVFYDSFTWDNHGLTQQYIHVLIELGIEFLFIYENKQKNLCTAIEKELGAYSKVKIYELNPELSSEKRMHSLFEEIIKFKPAKALLHITPWAVEALGVFNCFAQVTKYNINLTDHAYWLGSSIFDYNIEFRDYGATVSIEKRGLKKEQLIKLPYFPITKESVFEGFPEIANNKVIIFSGGMFYKIYGEKGSYFKIIKRLLDENNNAVLLYAGSGDNKKFKIFIRENNFQNRIALLGHRNDINEVFKNCDIYLGTYPFGGGLMSQYAAVNGKPILAYTDTKLMTNQIEGIVCHAREEKITFYDLDEFYKFANQLCSNITMRNEMGSKLKDCVISTHQFSNELKNILSTNSSNRTIEPNVLINYEAFFNLFLEVENFFNGNAKKLILIKYKLLTPILFPKLFFKTIFQFVIKAIN